MIDRANDQVIQDLRNSLAWLDLALASLNESVVVLDGELTILFANDALAKMLRASRIEFLGKSIWEVLPIYDKLGLLTETRYKSAKKSKRVEALSGNYELRTGNRKVQVHASVAHIASTEHSVIIIDDITKRLEAEAHLLRIAKEKAAREAAELSQKRILMQYEVANILASTINYEELVKKVLTVVCISLGWKVGIFWLKDQEQGVLQFESSWSDKGVGYVSFVRGSKPIVFHKGIGLPGQVWKISRPVWSRDVSKSKNFLRHKLASDSGLHSAFAVPISNGKEFYGVMEFYSGLIRKPDTELLTGMATVGLQVAEYMRRKSYEEISSALQDQKERLIELNNAKDEFISLASHQLRTPATGVKQYIAMLIDGYAGQLSENQKEFAVKAYESNERQITIVNDLLKIAQIDAGKVSIQKESGNLGELIINVLDEQKVKFEERNQDIVFKNAAPNLMAPIDVKHFRMALENIIDNASKYTEHGKNITVRLTENKDCALIEVQDEGIGISANDIEKIFTKFSRIDSPLSLRVGGTGLGLYWCKKILELHDGSITVKSKVGQGTKFTISLPKNS